MCSAIHIASARSSSCDWVTTSGPSGLRRADLLWRAVGMAHTIRAHDPECRVLVLTPELPTSTGKPAVRHLVDSGVEVFELGASDLLARLKALHG